MKTTDIERLEQEIERLIRTHLAECSKRAMQAVERGFAATGMRPRRRVEKARDGARARRPGGLVSELTERLYAAVCAHPGTGMAVLAAKVGATARQLERPAKRLREAGRIRSVGERNAMRYFPLPAKKSAA
jgi:hypothetical protein